MSVICPVCRSELKPITQTMLNASIAGRMNCPVCGYPIDTATNGSTITQKVVGWDIIVYRRPVVGWEQVKTSAQNKAASLGLQSSIDAPVSDATPWQADSVAYGLKETAKAAGDVAGTALGAAAKAAGSGVSGLLSGLGTPIVIIGVAAVLLMILMKRD